MGDSDYATSAVLLYLSEEVNVSLNEIRGNSDIGIYNYGSLSILNNNKVFDIGDDHYNSSYDYGIGNWGNDAVISNNKVKGFEVAYDGVVSGKNKVVGQPQPINEWF